MFYSPTEFFCRQFLYLSDYIIHPQENPVGVSRAAVHKAAATLTAQGYALEAAPRRGYRLAGGDLFCAEAIGDYPAPIYLYDTLESSNRTAKTLALEGAPHGTMVLTSQQTAGLRFRLLPFQTSLVIIVKHHTNPARWHLLPLYGAYVRDRGFPILV